MHGIQRLARPFSDKHLALHLHLIDKSDVRAIGRSEPHLNTERNLLKVGAREPPRLHLRCDSADRGADQPLGRCGEETP